MNYQKHQKRQSSMYIKKSCKAPKNCYKNNYGNPDSTNNSLAHPEETLDNETIQATNSSGHNGRGQVKAQTELTCAVSQAKRILNMCEISYEIHISQNLPFQCGGIILILFKIKPV